MERILTIHPRMIQQVVVVVVVVLPAETLIMNHPTKDLHARIPVLLLLEAAIHPERLVWRVMPPTIETRRRQNGMRWDQDPPATREGTLIRLRRPHPQDTQHHQDTQEEAEVEVATPTLPLRWEVVVRMREARLPTCHRHPKVTIRICNLHLLRTVPSEPTASPITWPILTTTTTTTG